MKLPGIKSQQGKDTKTLETIELFRGIVICYSLQFNRIMWSGQDPYQRMPGDFFPAYAVKLLQCNLYLKSFCSKLKA
jgi:hypothetical protein